MKTGGNGYVEKKYRYIIKEQLYDNQSNIVTLHFRL